MTLVLGDYPIVLLLVFARVSGILAVLPFLGITSDRRWLLAAAAFPITLLFCTVLPDSWREAAMLLTTPGDLFIALLGEALLGAAVGTVCGIFTGVFFVAGSMAGRSMSLRMAEEVDPMTGESGGLISQIWRMLFLVSILAMNMHLMMFRIVARTFERLPPPWTEWMHCGRDLAMLGATLFNAGVSLALPVVVVGLLVSLSMGLMARMAEEFSVLFLSLPFRLLSGMLVLSVTVMLSGGFLRRMAYEMLTVMARALSL